MSSTKEMKMEDVKAPPPQGEETNALLLSELKRNIGFLEKSVSSQETRLVSRVLRTMSSVRRRLSVEVLQQLVETYFVTSQDQSQKKFLLGILSSIGKTSGDSMETDQDKKNSILPEVEVYIHLLINIYLIDHGHYEKAIESSSNLINRLQNWNRRTLNSLSAKAFFYYSRAYELTNRLEEIRGTLLSLHRTACLRHNEEGQATLLNLLLRNYLHYNLYDQADKLVSKTALREDATSSNQYARYLYYQGRIRSVQLDYTEAYRCLLGAIRKAPQNSARGFRLAVYKLACIVQLLMGEIPEREIFRQPGLKKALNPYLQLTQAVRIGDLAAFHKVIENYAEVFKRDMTLTLISRLRRNVIKTGLKKINVAYSRISFADICAKLHLDSEEDAEFIAAKAIRDGVINATINHEKKYIQSTENIDIYSTQEPLQAFHKRITFCLNTHNEAIKAMRFPPDAHKPNLETAKERREREQEIAKNLVDEEEDEFQASQVISLVS